MKLNESTVTALTLTMGALMFGACSSSSNAPPPNDGGTAGHDASVAGQDGAAGHDAGPANADAASDADGSADADGGVGAPPALGAQIDRFGRPGINTAITDPFDAVAATHGLKQDAYNALTPSTAMSFEAAFETNLAIFDGLDLICGNQFAANTAKTDPTRYKPLADVLLDDQLYLDTSSGTCAVYLGVEANATAIIPNTDCGGRTLTEDVIDVTYSLLATGMVSGVTDGVAADDKVTSATFPYLAAPN